MSARKPSTPVLEPVLLLDLGAAWLRAALLLDGRPSVIPFASEGGRIPCCVGFDEEQLVLGDLARRLTLTQPSSQVTRALRVAGVRHELASLDGEAWRQVPVVRGRGGDVHFDLADDRWPLPRLLGVLIQQLVAQVERQREVKLERVVVAVAPGSDDARRRAIVQSLRIAGFEDVTLIHSTTAAAVAWSKLEREGASALGFAGLESMLGPGKSVASAAAKEPSEDEDEEREDEEDDAEPKESSESAEGEASDDAEAETSDEEEEEPEPPREQSVLVLDLGAGSCSASLVRLDGGSVEVLAARSRCDLGGDTIDDRLVEWLLEYFEGEAEVDLSGDPAVRARMRDVAEKAKIALSDAERHEIRLPFLWADPSGPKHLFVTLERARFERMIHELVAAVAALAQSVVADAGQDPNELDAVVMVGGTSRIPILQDRLEGLFGRVPETELGNPALDEDFVVRGLALEAHRRGQRRPSTQVVEIASRDLWLERDGAEPMRLVERGAPLPVRRSFDVTLLDGAYRAWLWEGDEDDRSRGPSLRVTLRAARKQVALELEVDRNGEVRVDCGREDVDLRVDQRVGLSARALRRFWLEADERARATAEREKLEQLRRRVQELARLIEGWLTDPKVDLDELLRTSLMSWNRDAEASAEHGDVELFTMALEQFLSLSEALPKKLLSQFDAAAIASQVQVRGAVVEGDGEGESEEPLGEESEDYGELDEVAPLLRGDAEDESGDEESEEDEEAVEAEEEEAVEEEAVEEEESAEDEEEAVEEEESAEVEEAVEEEESAEVEEEAEEEKEVETAIEESAEGETEVEKAEEEVVEDFAAAEYEPSADDVAAAEAETVTEEEAVVVEVAEPVVTEEAVAEAAPEDAAVVEEAEDAEEAEGAVIEEAEEAAEAKEVAAAEAEAAEAEAEEVAAAETEAAETEAAEAEAEEAAEAEAEEPAATEAEELAAAEAAELAALEAELAALEAEELAAAKAEEPAAAKAEEPAAAKAEESAEVEAEEVAKSEEPEAAEAEEVAAAEAEEGAASEAEEEGAAAEAEDLAAAEPADLAAAEAAELAALEAELAALEAEELAAAKAADPALAQRDEDESAAE